MRRRPALRSTGVVVCSTLLLLPAGCSRAVSLDTPSVSGGDATACRKLVDALPSKVADRSRVDVEVGDGYGAAWGDPAIELRCGVRRPAELDQYSQCENANGVDWFIPESQQSGRNKGRPSEITMTTVGRAQNVEVRIPADYWPPVNTMVDLAPAVKQAVRKVKPCV